MRQIKPERMDSVKQILIIVLNKMAVCRHSKVFTILEAMFQPFVQLWFTSLG